ncbi:VWA domain-containing protein [Haloechinothrix sp. YIM 98757]|uniref:VWA domain-containing protein n=1 Tax=Haloechinothrix aidingensis TaxID=2752311 RepID=A0A838AFX2_9PSEU|nr:substrate-binding and VWA domain-containing protein [Haloechinothrix aidingensis]MBA0128080.1 VWA domain-containing protein [Haloechinothrix aidingensis]
MGRHASSSERSRGSIVLLSTLLVLAIAGWLSFDFLADQLRASGCDSGLSINVTAAPDVAGVIEKAATQASEAEGEGCYHVNVTGRDSESTAESLVLSDGGEPPDVWIPESTMWLQHAQNKGAWDVPVSGTSIASTPVVLAVTDDTAGSLGWPDETPSWSQVIDADEENFDIGFTDPVRDPASLSALIGIKNLAESRSDPGRAYTSLLRRLSPNTVQDPAELFGKVPGQGTTDETLDAFPTTELALLRYNLEARTANLVASYPDETVPSLDFPYTVLPGTTGQHRTAAKDFLDRLRAPGFAENFSAAGLRTPEGEALRDRAQLDRTTAEAVPRGTVPRPDDVRQLLNEWAGVNLSARVQVLLDVSGSMAQHVPGAGKSRMAVTLDAAETGLNLFKPTTEIGVWLFSTNLDGSKPYRELLSVRPVSEHLSRDSVQVLRGVANQIGGNTGLYDSVLAAYRDATENWEAGRINIVVVLTDGKNAYPAGITRDELLAELNKLVDPRRPLQVIGIGIGPDVDEAELSEIAEATGGEAYTTEDPAKINEVFHAALSELLCQPPACKPDAGR